MTPQRGGLRPGDLAYPRWWWDDGAYHREDFPAGQDGRPTPGLVLDVLLLEEIDRFVVLVLSPAGNVMTLMTEDAILYRPPEGSGDDE